MPEDFDTKEYIKPTKKFQARQMDTFRELDTVPSDWVMCEITGMDNTIGEKSFPIFDEPDYTFVYPFTSKHQALEAGRNFDGMTSCELCGHIILYQCPIKCDSKKIIMYVGTECVNNFEGAGYFTKLVRIYKDSETKRHFLRIVEDLRNQCRDHSSNTGYIFYEYFQFIRKLNEVEDNFQEYSARQIRNVLKQALILKLQIDRSKEEIIEEQENKARVHELEKEERLKRGRKILEEFKAAGIFTTQRFKDCPQFELIDNSGKSSFNRGQIDLIKKYNGRYETSLDIWVIEI